MDKRARLVQIQCEKDLLLDEITMQRQFMVQRSMALRSGGIAGGAYGATNPLSALASAASPTTAAVASSAPPILGPKWLRVGRACLTAYTTARDYRRGVLPIKDTLLSLLRIKRLLMG